MKKYLLLLFSLVSVICHAQNLKVPAKVYADGTNSYVSETTVELRMADNGQTMVITVNPFPDSPYGLGYFFGQRTDLASTWQNLAVDGDNYWIISSRMKNSESMRHYLGFYAGRDGNQLYFYRKANDNAQPDYYRGYHVTFSSQDLIDVMTYIVSRLRLFRELPAQSY